MFVDGPEWLKNLIENIFTVFGRIRGGHRNGGNGERKRGGRRERELSLNPIHSPIKRLTKTCYSGKNLVAPQSETFTS